MGWFICVWGLKEPTLRISLNMWNHSWFFGKSWCSFRASWQWPGPTSGPRLPTLVVGGFSCSWELRNRGLWLFPSTRLCWFLSKVSRYVHTSPTQFPAPSLLLSLFGLLNLTINVDPGSTDSSVKDFICWTHLEVLHGAYLYSLINVDVKILSRLLVARLQDVITKSIHID